MNIQMSTIKTGISVFISIFLARVLKLEFPFFVALAVIMPIEESLPSSIKSGKNRMIGTVIGALAGVLFVLIRPGNPFLCGIGIIIIIYICNQFKLGSAAPIGGIVFISIMVNLRGKEPFNYAINRVIDTLVGVCIVIVVNYLIPSNKNKVFTQILSLGSDLLFYVKEVICFSKEANLEDLNRKILNIEGQLNKSVNESKIKVKDQNKLNAAKTLLSLYKNTWEHLDMIYPLKNACYLNKDNYNNVKLIYKYDKIQQKECIDTEMSTVFNYHVSKMIENINNIKKNIP